MSCVTTPTATVFSTPAVVQTAQRTITSLITVAGPVVSEVAFSQSCFNGDCVAGTTTNYYTMFQTITTLVVTDELVTVAGAPVPIETQYGSSCPPIISSPVPTPTPTPALTPSSTSTLAAATQSNLPSSPGSSSSLGPSATQGSDSTSHKSTNIGAFAGGAAAGVVALAVLIFFFFKFRQGTRGDERVSWGHGYDGGGTMNYPDPESGGGEKGRYSNSLTTPPSQLDRYNAKYRDSKSSDFGAQGGTADHPPSKNPWVATLSAPGPTPERKPDLIAGDKIPTNSMSMAMSKPSSSTPGGATADHAAANSWVGALSAPGSTSEKTADGIAANKLPTNSTFPTTLKLPSSTPGAAAGDQTAASSWAGVLSAPGSRLEQQADIIAADKIPGNSALPNMPKLPSSALEAATADQANSLAAALSVPGSTSEKKADIIAADKMRRSATSPGRMKPATGPGPSPSPPQTKPGSSSSGPQPADPPTIPTANPGSLPA
ncbi:hypothetical protein FRC01_011573 [Tulasnella sp. 417]|nr:hypothetical protein FRC01_011573 [Tulasnella sp. 417]